MRDEIEILDIPKQKVQKAYHGHTIIELHNHKSGSRERIESDNEFTLGINEFLRDGGTFNNSPFANSNWQDVAMYRKLIGGILLFDSEIEKVNGAYPTIMPSGVKMTANGSYGVTNNANPTELGSYNSNESSFSASALTFVYDYTTSQGNGDIACVSLTSDIGGYIGYGNSVSNVSHGTRRNLDFEQTHRELTLAGNISVGTAGIDGDTVRCITSVNTSQFVYTKKKYPVLNVDFFGEFAQTKTVSIPSSLVVNNTAPSIVYIGNGRFFAIQMRRLAANVACVVGIYTESTDLWEYINFTVPSGFEYTIDTYTNSIGVADGEYFVISDASGHKIGVNWDGSINNDLPGFRLCSIGEDLILATAWVNSGTSPLIVVDRVNNTSYLTNGQIDAYNLYSFIQKDNFISRNFPGTGSVNKITAFRNPLYLATVNNLDNTVVKTTSDTMKVIYTVTPA